MNKDELYDALMKLLEPLGDLINNQEQENRAACVAFSITFLAKQLEFFEALGTLTYAQQLVAETIPETDPKSLLFIV